MSFFLFLVERGINRLKTEEEKVTIKTCPFCYEEIALEAIKCPHCTADLEKTV